MSWLFKARDALQGHKGNSHKEKEKTMLINCLRKAVVLLNAGADDSVAARAEIIEGLNAVLVMING